MLKLEWLELSRANLLAIVDYISDDNPDVAQRVKDDIEEKAEKLPEFPKMGRPGRVEGTRELVVWPSLYHRVPRGRLECSYIACITCCTAVAAVLTEALSMVSELQYTQSQQAGKVLG